MKRGIALQLLPLLLALIWPLGLACGDGSGDGEGLPRLGTAENEPIIEGFGVESELVSEADFPASLAFAPDGRLFFNELESGNVRIALPDGTLLEEPFAQVDVARGGEWGLIGLALDPDFPSSHYVYIYFTAPTATDDVARPTVMRFTEVDNRGQDPTAILELPETFPGQPAWHVAGNIHFGPDGYLYVSVGDYTRPELAQDLSTPQGKILRLNKEDGAAPADNPFVDDPQADPRIFAYGFRNPFDYTFHPETGQLYVTESGEANCDELNLVVAGGNYGWPRSEGASRSGICQNPGAIEAIHYFTVFPSRRPGQFISTVTPTGIAFVTADAYPLLIESSLLICEFNLGIMRHYFLAGVDQDIVVEGSVVVRDCRLDIAVSPDGLVYYSNEGEIRRLLPQETAP